TTLAVAEEPEVRRLLDIPANFAVAAVVPLGRPARQLTKLRRLGVAEIATRERFGGDALTDG
ncbi:MAG: nitroreductase, partial [Alphaproteobacteria bacterium]|nr:nitroreductase [Alphaproteobacteria bacterium]